MSKEQKRYPVDTTEGLGFELSQDTREILRQLSNQEKPIPTLDRRQTQEIRNARGFLNLADAGLQGLDFHNPGAIINDDRMLARNIVLQVLCKDLCSSDVPIDRNLSYDKAVEAHRRIMTLRNPLDSLFKGRVSIPERILLSQSVAALEEMQAKIPPKPFLSLPTLKPQG